MWWFHPWEDSTMIGVVNEVNEISEFQRRTKTFVALIPLTHWDRVTHICVSKLTSIGSDNDLSPGRRQASFWTNAGILLIWPLETNFSEILIELHTFSFKKMHLNMSSGKLQPFCVGLNVLMKKVPWVTDPRRRLQNDWNSYWSSVLNIVHMPRITCKSITVKLYQAQRDHQIIKTQLCTCACLCACNTFPWFIRRK